MSIPNWFAVFISRKRWLKRILYSILPEIAYCKIYNSIEFHFDPKDMSGPSFHFAYDLEKGFNNYESAGKNKLLEFMPNNGVFFDIGANIGMYSVYFMLNKPTTKLYAFEPVSLVYRCLENSLQSIDGDIHLYNKAIGSINESKNIYKCNTNDGGHSFYNEIHQRESELVQVVNLDNFRESESIPLRNIVKIDVEGFELQVLKGMKQTLIKARPILLIESQNEDLAMHGEFWHFFNDLNYLGLYAMEADNSLVLNMNDLSTVAKQYLDQGKILSDYFFIFKK